MRFEYQRYEEHPFARAPGDDLLFGQTISSDRVILRARLIFSLASFSGGCYIAAMPDGQSGGNAPSTEARDDGVLLRAVAYRDKGAFQQLYTRHSPMLFGLAVKILSDRVEAEDVLQETFVQTWKTATAFDDQRALP